MNRGGNLGRYLMPGRPISTCELMKYCRFSVAVTLPTEAASPIPRSRGYPSVDTARDERMRLLGQAGRIAAQHTFAKGRLTEVFDSLFEFLVVPVRFRGECLELLAEFTEHLQGMVDRFSHGKSSAEMTNIGSTFRGIKYRPWFSSNIMS